MAWKISRTDASGRPDEQTNHERAAHKPERNVTAKDLFRLQGQQQRYTVKGARIATACIFLFCLTFINFAMAADRAPREYIFGVTPQFPQGKLYAIWKPIIDELEKKTGLSFRLVTTLKINDFEK